MQVTFHGAAREVTGSMHLLHTDTDRIALDCGLFQGRRGESTEKNRVMPIDPGALTNIVLSHAHIDHSGRLPLLTKNGFKGRILCTRATAAACEYLLPDSAHIQESDAGYLNYKRVRSTLSRMLESRGAKGMSNRKRREIKALLKHGHRLNTKTINDYIQQLGLRAVEPLYSIQDAERALGYFQSYPYREEIRIGSNTTCTFYEAGHILGSAMCLLKVRKSRRTVRILFTGDVGRFEAPILKNPCLDFAEQDRKIDLLILESTYGNKEHESADNSSQRLRSVLAETFERAGTVVIPAFAFGRTQTILYLLHQIFNEDDSLRVPVFVDSPLAVNLTRVFVEHPEVYDQDAHADFLQKGINSFQFKELQFVSSVEESMRINRQHGPQIVIAASGMCEAGRILHHLRFKIHDPKNTILLVGYMAQHTLGRRIAEKGSDQLERQARVDAPLVRFLGKEYPLRARVVRIDGFSAHADKNEMIRFLMKSNLRVMKIALVHGEEEQSLPFAKALRGLGHAVVVPRRGESVEVK